MDEHFMNYEPIFSCLR